ncbi:MAG: carbohydrate ABC transporter permease [Halofilum sp. (in: g-proteobacteria)]|nr:carbohydrate ABC transporter permease [Halofilum sp. (in: g-proteobacteria)]
MSGTTPSRAAGPAGFAGRKPWWQRDRTRRMAGRLIAVAFLLLFFLFPIYWLFVISIKTPDEIYSSPPVWIPDGFHLDAYIALFEDGDVQAIWNSLLVASVSTVLALLFGTMCAYSLARYRTGGIHLGLWIISQRMIPPIAIVFPVFLLYVMVGWVDTYRGLIVLYTTFNVPYVIWMMRGYILDIPLELEQSALVDGCNHWQVFVKVVFPMVRSGLFATAVFTFIFAWNDFVFALIVTRDAVTTFPVQITHYFGAQSTFWSKISAMSVLGTLPVMIAVGLLQRFLVRGMTMGAIKG